MARQRPARRKRVDDTHYLTGKRRGAKIREEVWYLGDQVVKHNLAYINPRICSADNGRVLGYDNSHDRHHRHSMGQVEPVAFTGYERLARRFYEELHEQWRLEDEQEP